MKGKDNLVKAEHVDPHLAPVASQAGDGRAGLASSVRRLLLCAVREMARTILPAILIALFVNVFVAQAMVVHGPSMQPNLRYQQRVIVEKVTYRFVHGPRQGDVVVMHVPGEDEPLIKRVVALPGEMVEVRDGRVFIDGQLRQEPWTTRQGGPDLPPTLVPALHVFVLGDNRASSLDSRSFGPVPVDQIIGRAWCIYWPLDQAKALR